MIKNRAVYIVILCFIWSGMLLGISFLEAPVKFTAPSLTLPVGLDVGRHVFQAFNKVEIVFGTLLFVLVIRSQLSLLNKLLFVLIALFLVLECVWLLPVLDERALVIIAGGVPENESPHNWYILFDALKLVALFILGVNTLKQLLKPTSN
ncbi:MAG: hypothetical protein IPP64_14625 [Bacteroidetes bacterium]|nr:hypothetical protein [Bacteroidota bacterium]